MRQFLGSFQLRLRVLKSKQKLELVGNNLLKCYINEKPILFLLELIFFLFSRIDQPDTKSTDT